ncbi:uncharacterized protein C17orf80 homolog isoform X2 [Sorex araneus]|uniref:uncharacterized protein C17orf80 homolog isoform X2 n=1 Tax=Sorex araneus TaxID=42254 RepID=UPI002433BE54|nr:uncharacterized protein C17orf80 homolog isoform X2 [Sorex araneus]
MEVCPYCKKPFKRLKSHLPHCKKIRAPGREDQKALPPEPAPRASAKKTKGPVQEEKEPGVGVGGPSAQMTRGTPGSPFQPLPPREVSVGGPGSSEAGGDIRNPAPGSLRVSGNAAPTAAGGAPRTPRAGRQRGSEPARTEAASPRGPGGPSPPQPERSCPSASAENVEAASARFGADRPAPSGQTLPGRAPGTPRGDSRSSTTGLGPEGQPRASEHISRVSPGVAASETRALAPGPPSLRLRLRGSPSEAKPGQEAPGPGPPLGGGACGGTGKAGESVAVARVSASGHSKKDLLGPGPRARDAAPGWSLPPPPPPPPPPRSPPGREPRVGPKAAFPSLATLTAAFLPAQEAEARPPRGPPAPRASLLSQLGCGEATPGAWPQAKTPPGVLPAPPLAQQSPPTAAAGALGLQWLPELYPAYLGLGVLPGRLQYWDLVALRPPLVSPQGESHSQGCLKCGTSVRSGVGSVTMLFTGYFVLCCNWSFRHLKLRWRK